MSPSIVPCQFFELFGALLSTASKLASLWNCSAAHELLLRDRKSSFSMANNPPPSKLRLCLGILGLIYVLAVLIYLKVRKNRREAARQGLASSHNSIEVLATEEEVGQNTQAKAEFVCCVVCCCECHLINSVKLRPTKFIAGKRLAFTSVVSHSYAHHGSHTSSHTHATAQELGDLNSLENSYRKLDSTSYDSKSQTKSSCLEYSRESPEDPTEIATPPSQDFFIRIRGMIAAAKNRLNSFRYRPTLLVIPEDDYFYQDFKERDIEGSRSNRKSFTKFSRKVNNPAVTKKIESIHGSNLGAAMLEAKLAPPLPPPRNAKSKSKKRAPSPPGGNDKEHCRESSSPVGLKDVGGSLDRKKRKINAENYSKFDFFRLDLYEKINRIREGKGTENTEITILEMSGGKKRETSCALYIEKLLPARVRIQQRQNKWPIESAVHRSAILLLILIRLQQLSCKYEMDGFKSHTECHAESQGRLFTNVHDLDVLCNASEERNKGSTSCCSTLEYPSGHQDVKISRRQLLYKLQETETVNDSEDEVCSVEREKERVKRGCKLNEKRDEPNLPTSCPGM
ncbi:uncharacterized protein TNCV_3636911 [Trichonephila clavipes]|nr:uncharacterized protein TNCV_3636911 [Trichonephila clavipes]